MKPFNLEAACKGEPLITRDGREVVWGGYNPKANIGVQLAVWINGVLHSRDTSGVVSFSYESPYDLFMAPKKRTVWVNISRGAGGCAYWHKSEEAAKCAATPYNSYLAIAVPVEIEE